MKTKEQIFKTKVLEQVKQLTNTGQHDKASKLFNKYFSIQLIMYESNTQRQNKKDFQKWLAQCPVNAIVVYQKQYRDEPKKYKAVIEFD